MKLKSCLVLGLLAAISLVISLPLDAQAQTSVSESESMLIGEIRVKGNHKIETATIINYIKTKADDVFSPDQISRDIQSIYNSGFFRDVQVDAIGAEGKLILTYIVAEKPSVSEIVIEGNDELDEEKIKKVIEIKINSILDEAALHKNAELIKKRYAEDGFYLAQVTVKIEEITTHTSKIVFQIEEGEEITIAEIKFEGNQGFGDDELKKILKTSEHGFMSWLTSSGYLKQEELDADMERLLAFYYDNGYIQAKITDPQVVFSEDKTELRIIISINEGILYHIDKIDFSGNHIIKTEELEEKLTIATGEVFNRSKVRKEIDSITGLYADQGYLLTQVYPQTKENPGQKSVDLTFNVTEGEITYAGKISISGNTSTREKVIRRELQFAEGEILTSSNMRRSYERINNLGFFEQVDLQPRDSGQKNALDIDLKVNERMTGSITMGAGWSSVNKVVGNVSVSQGNLFGRGQRLMLSGSFGRVIQTYDISFTEPWLFDMPLTAGFDLYLTTRRRLTYSNYQVDRQGGAISLSYPLDDYIRAYFTYRFEEVNVHDVPNTAPLALKLREGNTTTSSTTYAISRDSRDNYLRPSRGSRNKLSFETAGSILGGDNYYYRTTLDSSWHFPLFWKFVLSLHGQIAHQASYAGRELPIQELFTAGGAQTVRSFQYGALGPRVEGEVIGGNKLLVFNTELHFPIVDPLAGLIFFDLGNAFGSGVNYQLNNLRTGAGFGIRFYTPMGPIRLDWGYKLDRLPTESKYEWHFAMGTYF
ncbi:MAG: outer membrane protein assembly factor BamA [Candidatus Schekmanbacteria bacterium]|nr:outer membrane protein assembly factor BamA [Candidatus Schekmanbacteria bacterium]